MKPFKAHLTALAVATQVSAEMVKTTIMRSDERKEFYKRETARKMMQFLEQFVQVIKNQDGSEIYHMTLEVLTPEQIATTTKQVVVFEDHGQLESIN